MATLPWLAFQSKVMVKREVYDISYKSGESKFDKIGRSLPFINRATGKRIISSPVKDLCLSKYSLLQAGYTTW